MAQDLFRRKRIALTFDDGPNPFYTDQVLRVLDKYKVKAAFFIIGKYAEQHPEIVKDTVDRGHLVGNHGYYHIKLGDEYVKMADLITEITGQISRFIRFPYLYVGTGIKAESGVTIVGGELLNDWCAKDFNEILDTAEDKISDGAILILHDGSEIEAEMADRPEVMLEALPKLIEMIKAKGFDIVRLDELNF